MHQLPFLVLLSVQDDDALEIPEGWTTHHDYLIQDAWSLVNKVPSHAIEQADHEVQQEDRHS